MDGQIPNLNVNKDAIPGVSGTNMLFPSLFAQQTQIPSGSSAHSDLPWTKNQFQNVVNWVDQTKNLPMYNMFGSIGSNGSFPLDHSAWSGAASSSQSSVASSNPLLAAFQQHQLDYMGGKTNNSVNASSSALLGSFSDTRSLHAASASLNPPITQPKQPPKASRPPAAPPIVAPPPMAPPPPYSNPAAAGFSFSPLGQASSSSSSFSVDEELRNKLTQQLQNSFQQFPPAVQQIARPVPRQAAAAAAATVAHQQQPQPQTPFNLISSVNGLKNALDKANPSGSGFDFSQIFHPLPTISVQPSAAPAPSFNLPQMASTSLPPVPSIHLPPPNSISQPSTSSLSALQLPSNLVSPNALQVPKSDDLLISPRSGLLKRRSGGDPNRTPSENGLEGINVDELFELTQRDKEMLNSQFDVFEESIANPTSAAEDLTAAAASASVATPVVPHVQPLKLPKECEPAPPVPSVVVAPPTPTPSAPPPEEPKKKEEEKNISSAKSKMQRLLENLKNKSKAPTGSAATPSRKAAAAAPSPFAAVATPPGASSAGTPSMVAQPTTPASVPPADEAVFQKPLLPAVQDKKLTFTPPHSPTEALDISKPSTSGISSLISASILPAELMRTHSDAKKPKNVPIYLREKAAETTAPSVPTFNKSIEINKSLTSEKDDAFDFTDEDEETNNEENSEIKERDDEDNEDDERPRTPVQTDANGINGKIKWMPRLCTEVKPDESPKKETKKPAPVYPGRGKHVRPDALELAEKLRMRVRERIDCGFAFVRQSEYNTCAINSIQKNMEDADKPPLPRLLIRLPKKSVENGETEKEVRRRKKKRHYYDDEDSEEDDDDWYGGRPKRGRRGRKPKRMLDPDETYTALLVDPSAIEHARQEARDSKKARLLRHVKDDTYKSEGTVLPSVARGVEGKIELRPISSIVAEFKSAEIRDRLDKFGPCVGFTQRGTFLVLKSEIGRPDCSLWRVDNMNLLQKFPGSLEKNDDGLERIVYKNSSTYSGWCEQLQAAYMVVTVRHIRQTRSETVVEPEVPVADLFPAVAQELEERYCRPNIKALITRSDAAAQSEARTFILKDDTRNGLYMVLRNMMDGALSFDYFSKAEAPTVGSLENPEYELLNEMECQVKECEDTIKENIAFLYCFDRDLRGYSSCHAQDSGSLTEVTCQACGEEPIGKLLQLYGRICDKMQQGSSIDGDAMEDEDEDSPDTPLPAIDYYVCDECCKYALWRHRLIHFRSDLASRLENQILEATLEIPSLSPDQVIDNLRQSYVWMREVITVHTDTWNAILASDEDDDAEEEKESEKPMEIVDPPAAEAATEVAPEPAAAPAPSSPVPPPTDPASEPSPAPTPASFLAPLAIAMRPTGLPHIQTMDEAADHFAATFGGPEAAAAALAIFTAAAAAYLPLTAVQPPPEEDDSNLEIDPVTL